MNENIRCQENSHPPKKENRLVNMISWVIREFLAIFIWGYVITKLFVFDIDVILAEKFSPNYLWLINGFGA